MSIYAHIWNSSKQYLSQLNFKLASFYAVCGRMMEAQVIFNGVAIKFYFLRNFMIKGYASDGLYRKMTGLVLRLIILHTLLF